MRTIGLLGGMSWESSIEYYRLLNQAVRDRLDGLHSAECVMWSVDFAAIEQLQRTGEWNEAGRRLAGLAHRLEQAGTVPVFDSTRIHVEAAVEWALAPLAGAGAERE
jgi:aspartate racemase